MEMIVAFALFSTLMAIGLRAWSQFGGRAAENLAQRLLLQIEARKALVSLYRELQEGVEVVSPVPGSSLPYLVFKDSVNDLRMVYLADDPMETKKEGEPIFRMMIIRREVGKPSCDDPKTLMEHVKKIEFTTFHPGAVLVSGNLRGGGGSFHS